MNISFVIPAYQCRETLAETVAGILRAEMPTKEILLIDDGSRDGTAELCDSLAEQYPAVRCIHKENGGVSSARNLGIEAASGDYLWFVDADDTVCPLPQELYDALALGKPEIVFFGMTFDYWTGGILSSQEDFCPEQIGLFTASELGDSLKALFCSNSLSSACNKLFLRQTLAEKGLRFREDLINYEDLEFVVRYLADCQTVLIRPESCYHYRIQSGKDRTVERIARIPNLMGNTDVIADAFFNTAKALDFSSNAQSGVRDIVLALYLDLFRVRLLTISLRKLGRLCEDFAADDRVRQCTDALERLSVQQRSFYEKIIKKRTVSLWLRGRYVRIRSMAARLIKPLLRRA